MVYHEGALWFIMRERCGLLSESIVASYMSEVCIMREHIGL